MPAHFGKFVRRIRNKLDLNQQAFAQLLGLESREAVYHMERREERGVRGDTLEAMLELFGYRNEDELDAAWKAGSLPDVSGIEDRLDARRGNGAKRDATARDAESHWNGVTVAEAIEWLAVQSPDAQAEVLENLEPKAAFDAAQILMRRAAAVFPPHLTAVQRQATQEALRNEEAKLEARRKQGTPTPPAPAASSDKGNHRKRA